MYSWTHIGIIFEMKWMTCLNFDIVAFDLQLLHLQSLFLVLRDLKWSSVHKYCRTK